MNHITTNYRRAGWLMTFLLCAACGCQTVRTPEEKIANSNIPKEFTKVSMPDYIVEPPDLIIVEVLEALPGRPISGERLVRPDGKISLSFYGEVYVAGLTIPEVKEKIVLHLRKFIHDEVLGLIVEDQEILRKGTLLHDIGKISIPDAILNKAGPLTPEEYDIIKIHIEDELDGQLG